MIKNVVFYFPCCTIGGGQYLFIRYAEAMAAFYPEYKTYYIDYVDGFARKQIGENQSISFLDFDDKTMIQIPEYSVVIDPLNHLRHFDKYIKYNPNNTTFIFWCIAAGDLYLNKKVVFNYEIKRLGQDYSFLLSQNNIAFLGQSLNFRYSTQLCVPYHESHNIPIAIPTDKYGCVKTVDDIATSVRFCWLGRLDNDKYLDIVNYMVELEELSKSHQLTLTLIGGGACYDILKQEAIKQSYPIDFVGEKNNNDLDSFIRERVDIGLASGTSSLEFMLRGKPVIQSWNLDRIYAPSEFAAYHFPSEKTDVYASSSTRSFYVGQSTFINKFNKIKSNYKEACEHAHEYAISFSPKSCAGLLTNVIKTLDSIDYLNTDRHIRNMAKRLNGINHRIKIIKLLLNRK